jgi:N-acetylglucosaminyl-diphospho-decaprenol L-rhamnosyltransferase
MKLAIIILNYRTADLTIKASQAAISSLVAFHAPWCLVIVDNNSEDGSEENLRTLVEQNQLSGLPGWSEVSVVQSGSNDGFGSGNNHGIRLALEKYPDLQYVYILNSDAFPDLGAIDALVECLESKPTYAFAGSYIYGEDGEPHTTAFRFPTALSEFEGSIRLGIITRILKKYRVPIGIPEISCDVDWTAGASMLIRVAALRQIGPFDETFFLYFEETDLCLRAKRAGWRTYYVLESTVLHIGSASTGMKHWERIPSYWLDSRRHYFIKNHGFVYFIFATVLRIIGGSLHRIRYRVQRKHSNEPKHFVRDLVKHTLRKGP